MNKTTATITCEYGANFITEGVDKFSADYINAEPTGGLDLRTLFYATRIDYEGGGGEWYYNYLNYNAVQMVKGMSGEFGSGINKRAYAFVRLGYIPVVFLPSFCPTLNMAMIHILEQSGIPFVKLQPMAFGRNKLYGLNLIDAWVSKIDAAKYLGCTPDAVRSADLVRRIMQ